MSGRGRGGIWYNIAMKTPARVELHYRRPWEKDFPDAQSVRLIVYTVGDAKDPLYPRTAVNLLLRQECERRKITIVDWHLHIRGGMTPELAFARERDFCIRSTAMENHGREWEIYDNARLRDFAAECVNGARVAVQTAEKRQHRVAHLGRDACRRIVVLIANLIQQIRFIERILCSP